MAKGATKFKNLSELPDEVREKIYSLRLPVDMDEPIDEYMENFDNIVVENCMYHSDTLYAQNIVKEYKLAEEKHREFSAMAFPMVVIKNGIVVKNRFGKTEKPKTKSKMSKEEVLDKIKAHNDIEKRVEDVFDLIGVIKEHEYIDKIEFLNDRVVAYCENNLIDDTKAYDIPMEYLWMSDDDVTESFRKKLEEERIRLEEERADTERRKAEAKKKRQRTIYEKLKRKFEGQ